MDVLVVDDDAHVRALFEASLHGTDAHVVCERTGFRAMVAVSERPFDVIFMDLMMPGGNGLQAIEEIRVLRPESRIVVITGFATEAILNEAVARGVESCMHKPFGPSAIQDTVDRLRGKRESAVGC